ncbi:MAG: hypothetical protein K0R50_3533 [Eubacterium sp.]|jgi:VanZ family protein|nr:hypothetical protein [Eubacterium sp.]
MNYKKASIIAVIALLLIWVGFIMFMSSQTAENSGHMSRAVTKYLIGIAEKLGVIGENSEHAGRIVDGFDNLVRSLAHITMYFLLACIFTIMLWLWGLKDKKWMTIVFVVCFTVCIFDEINQMNYFGRNNSGLVSAAVEDVLKDTLGICCAIIIFKIISKYLMVKKKPAYKN